MATLHFSALLDTDWSNGLNYDELTAPTSADTVILNADVASGSADALIIQAGTNHIFAGTVATVSSLQLVGINIYSDPGCDLVGTAGCIYNGAIAGAITDDGSGSFGGTAYGTVTSAGGLAFIGSGYHAAFGGLVTAAGTIGPIPSGTITFNCGATLTGSTDGGGVIYAAGTFTDIPDLAVGSSITGGDYAAAIVADHANNVSGGNFASTLHMAGGGTFSGGAVTGTLTADGTIFTADSGGSPVVATGGCSFGPTTYTGVHTWTGTQTVDPAAVFTNTVTGDEDPFYGDFQSTTTFTVSFRAKITMPGVVTTPTFIGCGTGNVVLAGPGLNIVFQPGTGGTYLDAFTGTFAFLAADTPLSYTDPYGNELFFPTEDHVLSTDTGYGYGKSRIGTAPAGGGGTRAYTA